MQAFFVEVVPIFGGDDMSQRVAEIVCHHFGFATGAAGEIHQRYVAFFVHHFRANKGGGVLHAGIIVVPAFGHVRAYRDVVLHRGAARRGFANVLKHFFVAHRHYGAYGGGFTPILDVGIGEQMGGGNGYGAQFVKGSDGKPKLITALHNQHHHIAAADA